MSLFGQRLDFLFFEFSFLRISFLRLLVSVSILSLSLSDKGSAKISFLFFGAVDLLSVYPDVVRFRGIDQFRLRSSFGASRSSRVTIALHRVNSAYVLFEYVMGMR